MSEQIYTNKVSIVHFHIFMSFYSIYAILSRIRFCRDLRLFCVNFWGQKLRLRKFVDKYDVCQENEYSVQTFQEFDGNFFINITG